MAPKRPRLSERRKAVGSAVQPEIPSEVWLDRAEFQELIRVRGADTVPAPRSADVGRPLRTSIVAPRVPAEPTHTIGAGPSVLFEPVTFVSPRATIPAMVSPPAEIDAADRPSPVPIPGRSGLVRWFGVAGVSVLAVAGCAVWAVFSAFPTGPAVGAVPVAPQTLAADNPSPGGEGHVDGVVRDADPAQPAPTVTLDTMVSRAATAMPEAHDTPSGKRAISRHETPGSVTIPPRSDAQAIRDKVYSRLSAAFGPDNERWRSVHRGYSPHR
jgi:hypothetical protein